MKWKLIKVPHSVGSLGKNIGTEKAPNEIARLLNEDIWLSEDGGVSFEEIKSLVDKSEEVTIDGLTAKKINLQGCKPFFIGGDHSISYHCFKLVKEFIDQELGLLIFDAHPDVYQVFEHVTHQDWVKFLIDAGVVKKENVILVGIRGADKKEMDFLRENKIKFFPMSGVFSERKNVCDFLMETCRKWDNLYLSLDIDVVDPAFAPGTGYLEPGGLSSRELLYFLQRLKLLKSLRAVDLVEINPDKDVNGMTCKLGARIVVELL